MREKINKKNVKENGDEKSREGFNPNKLELPIHQKKNYVLLYQQWNATGSIEHYQDNQWSMLTNNQHKILLVYCHPHQIHHLSSMTNFLVYYYLVYQIQIHTTLHTQKKMLVIQIIITNNKKC